MTNRKPGKCRQCGNMGELTSFGECGSCLMKDEWDWVHEPEVTKARIAELEARVEKAERDRDKAIKERDSAYGKENEQMKDNEEMNRELDRLGAPRTPPCEGYKFSPIGRLRTIAFHELGRGLCAALTAEIDAWKKDAVEKRTKVEHLEWCFNTCRASLVARNAEIARLKTGVERADDYKKRIAALESALRRIYDHAHNKLNASMPCCEIETTVAEVLGLNRGK